MNGIGMVIIGGIVFLLLIVAISLWNIIPSFLRTGIVISIGIGTIVLIIYLYISTIRH
jgi:hypothetical protein